MACVALAASVAVACGASAPEAVAPVGVSVGSSAARIEFKYDSLDERPVTSDAMRGKPTLVTFVQTGSLWGQAQVSYMVAMAKNDGDRVNYVLIALEPRQSRELVEEYAKSLHVTFPVALGDQATLLGASLFGEVRGIPTTVLLDRVGRIVWRAEGRVAKSDELRAQMHAL
jgi:cytochrome oxidase Cu insertion factor (SCO1/SenC/PrrC family)